MKITGTEHVAFGNEWVKKVIPSMKASFYTKKVQGC
jgi:hypothetical protein